jgi:hypothetical protein
MPPLCSRLFSTSTTTTINQADPFLGFVKRNYEKKRRILEGFKEERKVDGALKSSNKADLQSIFNTLEKLQSLRSLSLGYIGYSAQFLTMTPISQLENLRILNITVPIAKKTNEKYI